MQGIAIRAGTAVNLAAFTSASGSLIAAVRGVCNPNSRFRSCHALLGIGILCRQKKEYDA